MRESSLSLRDAIVALDDVAPDEESCLPTIQAHATLCAGNPASEQFDVPIHDRCAELAARSASRRRWLRAIACAAWGWPLAAVAAERRPWPRNRPSPRVQLPGLDGAIWSLAAARGRPVLLNFWASWCEPCRDEIPSLQRLAARHRAQGLAVMAVNYRENDDAVKRFVDATSLGLPVLRDLDGGAAKAFGVRAFPSTVIVDRQGRVLSIVFGECDWNSSPAHDWVAAAL